VERDRALLQSELLAAVAAFVERDPLRLAHNLRDGLNPYLHKEEKSPN
jgi:hypothetical protein